MTFPALSDTVADALTLPPSAFSSESPGTVLASRPESASPAVHAMVTGWLYHPALFGAVVAAPVNVGGVVSTLMGCSVADAVFPAVSTACR